MFLGLTLTGLSAGLVTIPVLPEMLESVESDKELADKFDLAGMESLISGLFIFFQSIGEASGPVVSSYLTDKYGFTTSQEVYTAYLTIFFIAYFFTCGNFSMFGKATEFKS